MNLEEIVEKNNLTVGDSVLCTYSERGVLELGEHVIQKCHGGFFPRLIDDNGISWWGDTSEFELIGKKRHVHADLIIWWAECPSENIVQLLCDDGQWRNSSEGWCDNIKYRKKPTDTELVIENLFDTSAKVTTKYIDDLHCLAKKIHELKGNDNGADKGG